VSWKNVSLADVSDVFNGKTPSKDDQRDVGHPVLKIKDVGENGYFKGPFESFVDLELAGKFSEKHLKLDDSLILNAAHNSDYVGSKQYRAEQAVVGALPTGEWLIARANTEKLHPRFLNYWLQSPQARFQIKQLVKGIHLYPKDVMRLEIPLPPLPEQKRIAAILDKADAIRRKRQQAIQLADDFLRAVFLDMFGDPVTNPKGWEVDGLEQLSTRVTKGESPKWQGFEYGSEGVRFITSENVLWGSLDERMKFIPLEFHQKLKRSQVQEGDLLINLVGASVGRACLAELNGMPANINQAVSVTTLDRSRLLPEIALYQLLVPSMQRVLLGNVVDAARANISLADIRDLQMLVPPIDMQLAFRKVLGKVKKCVAVNSSFTGLNLFESLSHNAFSGQL